MQKHGFAHVGYLVPDREAAIERFSELFGIKEWQMVEFKPFHAITEGEDVWDGYYLRCALSLPAEGTRIEVVLPVSDGYHKKFVESTGGKETLNHFAHLVDEYEKYRDKILEKGAWLLFDSEMEDEGRGYRRSNYMYDETLNTIIEYAEIPYYRPVEERYETRKGMKNI